MDLNKVLENTRASFALVKKDISDVRLNLARMATDIEKLKNDQKRIVDQFGRIRKRL
ncbi:hypothetical protein HYU11_02690 [Candidatus Woesearchaeota archaeon]|nr:hypothetical protein [Candidatus Woesearchaeota archaeon]